jgi:hypothetical protein
MDLAELDTKWSDEVITRNQSDRAKLEVELKTYSNNMIKESIRVSRLILPFSPKFLRTKLDGTSRLGRIPSNDR